MKKFIGTGVAIVTPFRDDSSLDFTALGKLVNHLVENGVQYLVVLGTTGESVTLSYEERRAVIDYVIEVNNGRVPIVVGFGSNNTQDLISQLNKNSLDGIDAILSVAPYYNKPNQEGLFKHFKSIATACPIPIILYNVPGRTGSNISAETSLELAHKFENIIAIKEASGNLDTISRIVKDKPSDFQVISGDDALSIPIISMGGSGVISVLANAYPTEVSNLVSMALEGNYQKARDQYFEFIELIDLLFCDGNPAGIKAVLSRMDLVSNAVRLPLTTVRTETYDRISKIMTEVQGLS